MADGRALGFSKVMQKHAGRAKERFLQNLGKADKTTDELFNTYVNNFNKQQTLALKLQKELKNYVTCVRAMQAANKGMMDTISEIYEQEWIGHEQIPVKAQAIDLIWEDFGHKMHDQVTIPLNNYLSQFSEIRNKIAKRGRKLVDYDGCRHNVEALHQTGKKRDDMKITKAREQMEEAKRLYEVINTELNEELPALYDSRIPFLVSNLQTVYTAETVFHVENSKIYAQLSELMEKLALEHQRGAYITRKSGSPKIQRGYRGLTLSHSKLGHGQMVHPYWSRSSVRENDIRHYEEIEFKKNTMERKSDHFKSVAETNGGVRPSTPTSPVSKSSLSDTTSQGPPSRAGSLRVDRAVTPVPNDRNEKDYEPVEANSQLPMVENIHNGTNEPMGNGGINPLKNTADYVSKKVEELYDIPVGATTTDLPPGVLYRVRATYKYAAEDVDELAFEMGEIIRVIEYEDPEEQEEGWLMGMKETSGEKGLFPANFTRPI